MIFMTLHTMKVIFLIVLIWINLEILIWRVL
ncbi:hypothetical protein Godav_011445 [Gossypium davidsonii]|uniref:Uncharacterized protein n=2 Tax=Gossypium TaxID=3633 RepID=A0A7J8RA73_GOSDV|nr:hypothetical protein [Gossypium davidsonii]MBA0645716.1 hypothetical protein [Gossypium klotzschianum]